MRLYNTCMHGQSKLMVRMAQSLTEDIYDIYNKRPREQTKLSYNIYVAAAAASGQKDSSYICS